MVRNSQPPGHRALAARPTHYGRRCCRSRYHIVPAQGTRVSKRCPACEQEYPETAVFCPTDGATLVALSTGESLVGAVIADRYLIERELGEGGMGRVYLGRHVRLPQQVAVKVMRPDLLTDPAAVARFTREAANASRIEHERVARVYDFGQTADSRVYLAMEFVRGRTLRSLLADEGPLTLGRTVALVRQVADGLDEAHRLGIVHRDLKPDNIMVGSGPAGEDRCKIVDFGIAKAIAGAHGGGDGRLTRTGYVVGTPEYMSPEQLLAMDADHRVDVYALALVAYQCLTGSLPFDTATPDRGLSQRLLGQVRPLRELAADIPWPPALEAALLAGLAVDAEQRTASCGAFSREIAAATTEEQGRFTLLGRAPVARHGPAAEPSVAQPPGLTEGSADPLPLPAAPERQPLYTRTPPPTPTSASLVRQQMRRRQLQQVGRQVLGWAARLLLLLAVASWFTRPAGMAPQELATLALTHPVTWARQTVYGVVDQDRNGAITPADYEAGVARIKAWAQDSSAGAEPAGAPGRRPPAGSPGGSRR